MSITMTNIAHFCKNCGAALDDFKYSVNSGGYSCPGCGCIFATDEEEFNKLLKYRKAYAEANECMKAGCYGDAYRKVSEYIRPRPSDVSLHHMICEAMSQGFKTDRRISYKAYTVGRDSWYNLEHLNAVDSELQQFRQKAKQSLAERISTLKWRRAYACLADIMAVIFQILLIDCSRSASYTLTAIIVSVLASYLFMSRSDPYHIYKSEKLLETETNPFEMLEHEKEPAQITGG